jgi:hypothetical protein
VIALDAGPKTRLLAWRSGLAHPIESTPIAGPAVDPPPLVVLPGPVAARQMPQCMPG